MRIGHRELSLLALLLLIIPLIMNLSITAEETMDKEGPTRSDQGPGSSTIIDSDDDFENGTLSDVRTNGNGGVELEHVSRYVLDDFLDDSMIAYMESTHLDEQLGVIEQEPVMTFGSMWEESTQCSIKTSDGGFLIAGYHNWNNPNFGIDMDIELVRFDSNGIVLWNHTVYSPGRQDPYGICETNNGGYAIVGKYTSDYGYGGDTFLMILNSTGHHQWNKTYDIGPYEFGRYIEQNPDGSYLIVGEWQDIPDGGYYLMGLDKNGNEVWNRTTHLSYTTVVHDVIETAGNDIVLVGEIYSGPSSYSDVFTVKVEKDGDEVWNKTMGDPINYEYFHGVVEDSQNNLLICGQNREWATNYDDGWLVKLDPNGDEIWNLTYDFQEYEMFYDILAVENGFVVTGWQRRGGYNPNMITVKVNSTGGIQWGKLFGGANADSGNRIHTLGDGFLVAGTTNSFGNGGQDMMVMITNSTGNFRRARIISTNLMEGRFSSGFEQFEVISDTGVDKKILVRFSTDGENWYDSQLVQDDWDEITSSPGRIDLTSMDWNGSSFYYEMKLESSGSNSAVVGSVKLKYSTYSGEGAFFSHVIDLSSPMNWSTLEWEAETPEGTAVEFQFRTSNSASNIATKSYLGPDGTDQTFYTDPGAISPSHYGSRCLQFKAYLRTSNRSLTPRLDLVTIVHNCLPQFVGSLVDPSMGDVTDTYQFKVYYKDMDDDQPETITVDIDGTEYPLEGDPTDIDHTDGRSFSTNLSLDHGNHNVTFKATDGADVCSTDPVMIFVGKGPLDVIEISSDIVNITTDDEVRFTAMGYDTVGNQIEVFPIWEVSGGGTIDTNGLFTATYPGKYTVYANFSDVSGSMEIVIDIGEIDSISISPMDPTMTTDDELHFSAMGCDADGNEFEISPKWSVTGGGSINDTGFFEANVSGTFLVTAFYSGIYSNSSISISPGGLARIELTANRTEVYTEELVLLTVMGFDNDSNVLDIEIELVSDGGSLDKNGFFASSEAGVFNITARASGIEELVTITVLKIPTSGPDDDDDSSSTSDSQGITWLLIFIPALVLILIAIIIGVLLVSRLKHTGTIPEDEKGEDETVEEQEPEEEDIYGAGEEGLEEVLDHPPPDLEGDIEGHSVEEEINDGKGIIWDEDHDEDVEGESSEYLW